MAATTNRNGNPPARDRDAHDFPYGHGGRACPFGLKHLPANDVDDCCTQVLADWRDTPCLHGCHYPRVLAPLMLMHRDRYAVAPMQPQLLPPAVVDRSDYVAEPGVPARARRIG